MKTLGMLVALSLGLIWLGVPSAVAAADHNAGEVSVSTGPGQYTSQYAKWDRAARKLKLSVNADSSLSTSRCLEVTFDWRTEGGSHYDQRTVRNCDPGSYVTTDPAGDGYWHEPSGWNISQWDADVNGVRVAAGLRTTDSHPSELVATQTIFGGGDPYTQGRNPPGPDDTYWAAVRTRYQNGSVASNRGSEDPERCWNQPVPNRNDCEGAG
jgi:hypothetical protein